MRYARHRRITAEPIRSLSGVLDRFKAYVATMSHFTEPARDEVEKHFWRIELRDFDSVIAASKECTCFAARETFHETHVAETVSFASCQKAHKRFRFPLQMSAGRIKSDAPRRALPSAPHAGVVYYSYGTH